MRKKNLKCHSGGRRRRRRREVTWWDLLTYMGAWKDESAMPSVAEAPMAPTE